MFDFREWRLRRSARRLTWLELQTPDRDDEAFTAADLYEELFRKQPDPLFLGHYTRRGIEDALRTCGTWGRLEAAELEPRLAIHRPDGFRHLLRITDGPDGPVIVELLARFAALRARVTVGSVRAGELLDLVAIEWLLLQHPRRAFTRARPRLPGQTYPGLGMGREVQTVLGLMGEQLGQEGLIGIPEHYHNAVMYSEKYRFFSPQREGEFLALRRDLSGLTLAGAGWAVERELVTDLRTGAPYRWLGEEMVRPLADRVAAGFASREYRDTAARACAEARFAYDPSTLQRALAQAAGR